VKKFTPVRLLRVSSPRADGACGDRHHRRDAWRRSATARWDCFHCGCLNLSTGPAAFWRRRRRACPLDWWGRGLPTRYISATSSSAVGVEVALRQVDGVLSRRMPAPPWLLPGPPDDRREHLAGEQAVLIGLELVAQHVSGCRGRRATGSTCHGQRPTSSARRCGRAPCGREPARAISG